MILYIRVFKRIWHTSLISVCFYDPVLKQWWKPGQIIIPEPKTMLSRSMGQALSISNEIWECHLTVIYDFLFQNSLSTRFEALWKLDFGRIPISYLSLEQNLCTRPLKSCTHFDKKPGILAGTSPDISMFLLG